jgi:hypothetical protein
MEVTLQQSIWTAEDPQIIGALGAALLAHNKIKKGTMKSRINLVAMAFAALALFGDPWGIPIHGSLLIR